MKRGSREIGKSEGISSRQVRHRYRIFQNFRPVAVAAKPVDERKELGGGPEQPPDPFYFRQAGASSQRTRSTGSLLRGC
jgi:hypothetical protein